MQSGKAPLYENDKCIGLARPPAQRSMNARLSQGT